LPLPAKRQKSSAHFDTVPIQQTVDTKGIASSISARTVEKIKQFSALHNVNGEQMEFDGTFIRQTAESIKTRNEHSLCDILDIRQDSAELCHKGEGDELASNSLSFRYSEVIRSMLKSLHLRFCLLSGLFPYSFMTKSSV
jgi:hypothetical protein